ncbi:MAG: electron transfer flavoprotein subunit alpha/FixB family protein [Clostridiales bacterium]|nr:electron transfer flavoprotein subunit alpha/FixB family protein [Clostridiales bacterium]
MEAKNKNLWVLIEADENGKAKNVGLELLSPGRDLATKQGGELVSVVIGSNVDEAVKSAIAYGTDKVIVVDGPEYAHYTTDAYTAALYYLVEKYGPTTILIGATNTGRDLGPRLSCRLKTGLTADCTALDIDADSGNVAWTRPAFGGNLMATILCPDHRPQIGTVRPGVFKKSEPDAARTAEVIKEEFSVPAEAIRTQVLEVIKEEGGELVDLEGAEIIISGGRGVGSAEGFAPIQELADVLGATVGASRAAVDAGWISHSHQVGQTGKTVGPKLYIACGISGAIQHVAGMNSSDVIVAINKDPEATIFEIADYGVVGNLFEVLPVLTEEIKKLKA